MIDTILFDLDGTLLPIEMDDFERVYFRGLGAHFQDIIEPEKLFGMLHRSMQVMVENTEKISNEKVFMDAFSTFIDVEDLAMYQARFMDFYASGFNALKTVITPNPWMREAITLLKTKQYNLIVATNPLFPKLAIDKRIEWAGFDVSEFSYVTDYEQNHYCKPHLQYYEEILSDNKLKPEQCLMVGNDPFEDMIASKLNMTTFLIEDHVIERDNPIPAHHQGSYEDFYEFVKQLPTHQKEQ